MKKFIIAVLTFLVMSVHSGYANQTIDEDGFRREFYEDGQVYSETNCFKDNQTGVYREYYENGTLKMEVNYEDGQMHGVYQDYCDDGSLHTKFQYKNNKRDGQYKLFYENGKMQSSGIYKDGKEIGRHSVYYPNGNLAAEVHYDDGLEQGFAKTYYQNGQIWEEFHYINGLREGQFREFNQDGIVIREIVYEKNEIVSVVNFDLHRELFMEVMNDVIVDQRLYHTDQHGVQLRRCVSRLLGMEFACDPDWKLERNGKKLRITIAQIPTIEFEIEEKDSTFRFISELSRPMLEGMNRYAPDFQMERIQKCQRETLKVNGFAKDNPNRRYSDYYLLDHHSLHLLRFTVDPKQAFEDYQWLIKDIVDSLKFVKHQGESVSFFDADQEQESCEDLIEE